MEVLLECDEVDINVRDWDMRSALALAAKSGHADAVAVLLRCSDVDVNERDADGRTPLELAMKAKTEGYPNMSREVTSDYTITLKLLIENGGLTGDDTEDETDETDD
jgi:ankyrin repeat protein